MDYDYIQKNREMIEAAKRNDLTAVQDLITQRILPTSDALEPAIKNGNADMVRLMISSGADPDAKDDRNHGRSYLWAIEAGQPHIIPVLQDAGASFTHMIMNVVPALAEQHKQGKTACLHAMLKAGMPADAKDGLLMRYAIDNDDEKLIYTLTDIGFQKNQMNIVYKTPLEWAIKNNKDDRHRDLINTYASWRFIADKDFIEAYATALKYHDEKTCKALDKAQHKRWNNFDLYKFEAAIIAERQDIVMAEFKTFQDRNDTDVLQQIAKVALLKSDGKTLECLLKQGLDIDTLWQSSSENFTNLEEDIKQVTHKWLLRYNTRTLWLEDEDFETSTISDFRNKTYHPYDNGFVYIAYALQFDRLIALSDNQDPLRAEDLLREDDKGNTVLDILGATKQLSLLADTKLWKGQEAAFRHLYDTHICPLYKDQIDIDFMEAEFKRHKLKRLRPPRAPHRR